MPLLWIGGSWIVGWGVGWYYGQRTGVTKGRKQVTTAQAKRVARARRALERKRS